jgi:hypothetical protein
MPDSEAIGVLRRHPRFADAMMQAARNAVELYQGSRLTNLIANDRGRFILSIAPLYLHATRQPGDSASGFTATRLKQFAVNQEICSAGRAAAMLALMRWAGMIAPAPAAADRRVRLLEPTERLIGMHRVRWRRQLQAAALVLPDLATAADRLDNPAFVSAFAVAQTRQFIDGFRFKNLVPELSLFFERSAGLLILACLLLASAAEDGTPGEAQVAASSAGLAKRFHVSRTHVITLLHDAVVAGLIMREASGNRIRVLPGLLDASERFFSAVFLYNQTAAQEALTAVPGNGARA